MKKPALILSLFATLLLGACSPTTTEQKPVESSTSESTLPADNASVDNIPSSEQLPVNTDYIVINDNVPQFSDLAIANTEPYTYYSPLDELGRTGQAHAYLDPSMMPDTDRSNISDIYPSGWKQGNYDTIDNGGWLYNRSHLIGYQLAGDDNPENLLTGTRQFNVDGMLPFENYVANHVETTSDPVIYRVTPVYDDDNLLSHGVQMEAYSPLDDGESVMLNVFIPNQQEGIQIDYTNGSHTQK